jgi:hypothetical protein
MNKLELAMNEVIARLTALTPEQISVALNDVPDTGFGSIFVQTGSYSLYLESNQQTTTPLQTILTRGEKMSSSNTCADYTVDYERATCLLAA